MKLFYRLFYKGFIRYHESNKATKDTLTYAFTDYEGYKYFTFTDQGQIPKCRYERLMNLTMWWEARVSPATVDMLADGIIEAAELSLTAPKLEDRSKAISRAMVFANELKLRKDNGIPATIAHEMAAVWAIREDEEVGVINEQLHDEKVEMFAYETSQGRDFFLHMPMFMRHLNLWRVSRVELKKLFAQSEIREKQSEAIALNLLSELKSKSTTEANET